MQSFSLFLLFSLCCVSCHADDEHRRKAVSKRAASDSGHQYQWVDYGTPEPPDGFDSGRRTATTRPAEFQVESNYKAIRIKVEFADSESLNPTGANYLYLKNTIVPEAIAQLEKVMKVIRVKGKLYADRECVSYWGAVGSGGDGATTNAGVGRCQFQEAVATAVKVGDYTTAASNLKGLDVFNSDGTRIAPDGTDMGSFLAGSGGWENYDYILWVGSKACADSGTIAYAAPISYDQYDRPVTGYFTYCPTELSTAAVKHQEMLSTVVHEVLHAFGFTSTRFAYWYDHATGQPRTARDSSGVPNLGNIAPYTETIFNPGTDVYASFTERGHTVWKLKTPSILSAARAHFGCTTMNGLGMEQQGGSGTRGSHWEQKTMLYDVMGGTSETGPVWTKMSLGFLYDTGHYMVEWSMGSTMRWGLNAGCSFVTDKCLTPGVTPTVVAGGAPYFCIDAATKGCAPNSLGMGTCNVITGQTASSPYGAIPSYFQYWTGDATKGGNGANTDKCPYIQVTKDCRYTTQSEDTSGKYGETASATSRCFTSTLTKVGETANPFGASCLQYECTSTELRIYIHNPTGSSSAGGWVSCPTAGGVVDPPLDGVFTSGNKVTCPEYSTFCPQWVYFSAPGGVTQSTHAAWAATGGTGSAEYQVPVGGQTTAPSNPVGGQTTAPSNPSNTQTTNTPSSAPTSVTSSGSGNNTTIVVIAVCVCVGAILIISIGVALYCKYANKSLDSEDVEKPKSTATAHVAMDVTDAPTTTGAIIE